MSDRRKRRSSGWICSWRAKGIAEASKRPVAGWMSDKQDAFVQEGPTLVLALDAPTHHPESFAARDPIPYCSAQPPPSQQAAIACRRIMRKARSSKKRAVLLADLEHRYRRAA